MDIYSGTVIWFKKNYGFIQWSKDGKEQKDLFIHYSDIKMEGFKILKPGQFVNFSLGVNHSGNPKAIELIII
jgi:CspA family cold shock protein